MHSLRQIYAMSIMCYLCIYLCYFMNTYTHHKFATYTSFTLRCLWLNGPITTVPYDKSHC